MKLVAMLALLSISCAALARPATKNERKAFCRALSQHYEDLASDTGIDLGKCQRTVRAQANFVGPSAILDVTGRVEHLHLESSWMSDCSVKFVQGRVVGTPECVPVSSEE